MVNYAEVLDHARLFWSAPVAESNVQTNNIQVKYNWNSTKKPNTENQRYNNVRPRRAIIHSKAAC